MQELINEKPKAKPGNLQKQVEKVADSIIIKTVNSGKAFYPASLAAAVRIMILQ